MLADGNCPSDVLLRVTSVPGQLPCVGGIPPFALSLETAATDGKTHATAREIATSRFVSTFRSSLGRPCKTVQRFDTPQGSEPPKDGHEFFVDRGGTWPEPSCEESVMSSTDPAVTGAKTSSR